MPASPRQENPFLRKSSANSYFSWVDVGIDHVGCGFDFFEFIDNPDTMGTMTDTGSPCTKGLANCSEIPNLFACFEKMGMSKEDMEKIARLNFQRVVKDAIG